MGTHALANAYATLRIVETAQYAGRTSEYIVRARSAAAAAKSDTYGKDALSFGDLSPVDEDGRRGAVAKEEDGLGNEQDAAEGDDAGQEFYWPIGLA
jgi:hypothetical protein